MDFSDSIIAYDIKVDIRKKLNELLQILNDKVIY